MGFFIVVLGAAISFYVFYAVDLFEKDKSAYVFESVKLQNDSKASVLKKIVEESHSELNLLINLSHSTNSVKSIFNQNKMLLSFVRLQKGKLAQSVMEELAKHYGDKIHLDIYSSFEAYGWPERDEPYLDLFQRAKNNPQMTYHGFQPNHVIREALQNAHIFAYPCIWQETSCIAAIEAISAGCEVVCPNYAALPETTAGFGRTYQWNEDPNYHANVFVNILHQTIENYWNDENQNKLNFAKNYIDNFYNWDVRAIEWTAVLQSLLKKS